MGSKALGRKILRVDARESFLVQMRRLSPVLEVPKTLMDRLSGVCHLDVGGDMGEVGERESLRERFGQSKSWGAQDNSIISLASG